MDGMCKGGAAASACHVLVTKDKTLDGLECRCAGEGLDKAGSTDGAESMARETKGRREPLLQEFFCPFLAAEGRDQSGFLKSHSTRGWRGDGGPDEK